MASFGNFMKKKLAGKFDAPGEKVTRSVLASMSPGPAETSTKPAENLAEPATRIISSKIGFLSQPQPDIESSSSASESEENDLGWGDKIAPKEGDQIEIFDANGSKELYNVETENIVTEAPIQRPVEASKAGDPPPSKKRKRSSKDARQEKTRPKVRSKARLQQNFRECFLNTKKKVSQLQPNHGTQSNFFYAVENNVQDATVRGAAKTAGKIMVYGQGPLFQQFLAAGIKHDKKNHYVCQNDFDFEEHQFSDAD